MINIIVLWNTSVELEETFEGGFRAGFLVGEFPRLVSEVVEVFLVADGEWLAAGWAKGRF